MGYQYIKIIMHTLIFLADNIRKFTSFDNLLNSEIGDVFIKDISILKNNNIFKYFK